MTFVYLFQWHGFSYIFDYYSENVLVMRYVLLFLLPVFFAHAQVDPRKTVVIPEQEIVVLDSTYYSISLPKSINQVEIVGDFSGKIHVYGTRGKDMAEVYHVYKPNQQDERAIGLREVSIGSNDNTGVGLEVTLEENTLRIRPGSEHFKNKHYAIYIPDHMLLKMQGTGYGGAVVVTDFAGEIIMEKMQASITLHRIIGKAVIETKQNIEVIYDQIPTAEASYTSHIGLVDVAMPAISNVTVEINNNRLTPRIFSDLNLKMISSEKHRHSYQLNDGKLLIQIYAPFGNVYLRELSLMPQ